MTWSPAFSRASGNLVIFALTYHWRFKFKYFPCFLWIGCCDYFGFIETQSKSAQTQHYSLIQSEAKLKKTNHDLVAHVSPRFRQLDCSYFEFSLGLKVISLL